MGGVVRTDEFPLLALLPGVRGTRGEEGAGSFRGVKVGCVQGPDWRGGLVYFAHCFPGGVYKEHAQYTAFTPYSSEVAAAFLVFLYLFVHNLP